MTGFLVGIAAIAVVVLFIFISLIFRRVVPTNMVHIIQRGKTTVSYGKDQKGGNVYYAFPSAWPKIGVSVIKLPVSNFNLSLTGYEAYDSNRVPFKVDVTAFFRIDNTDVAAQRVATFIELEGQLTQITQGAVRKVLASAVIDDIMIKRSTFGEAFTNEVKEQLKDWGIATVKAMELMDIRDSDKSTVIDNIMAKKISFIHMESQTEVAENNRKAEIAVMDAKRAIEVNRQQVEQDIATKTAEKDRMIGIAQQASLEDVARREIAKNQAIGIAEQESDEKVKQREVLKYQTVNISKQQAEQQILEQTKIAKEKEMEVQRVKDVQNEQIAKSTAEVLAEKKRQIAVIEATATAEVIERNARAAKLKVELEAEAAKRKIELEAEADATQKTLIAEAEAKAVKLNAEASAEKINREGNAEADITKAKGLAEAEALRASALATAEGESKLQIAKVQGQIDLAKEIGGNQGYQQYLVTLESIKMSAEVGIEQAKALSIALEHADMKIIANTGSPVEGVNKLTNLFSTQGATNLNGWVEALKQGDLGKALIAKFLPTDPKPADTAPTDPADTPKPV
ncbi:MAG: hypothetical protein LBW77_07270 [Verrucomicrobiota bacterium]|jgi:flotillin|nr:hypothetical protein [Verrucomicrobiota bacterium]